MDNEKLTRKEERARRKKTYRNTFEWHMINLGRCLTDVGRALRNEQPLKWMMDAVQRMLDKISDMLERK